MHTNETVSSYTKHDIYAFHEKVRCIIFSREKGEVPRGLFKHQASRPDIRSAGLGKTSIELARKMLLKMPEDFGFYQERRPCTPT